MLPWASIYLCSTYIVFTTVYIALHFWYSSIIILHVINNLEMTKYMEYNLLELSQDGRLERPWTHLLWKVHLNHNYQQNNHFLQNNNLCKRLEPIRKDIWNLKHREGATVRYRGLVDSQNIQVPYSRVGDPQKVKKWKWLSHLQLFRTSWTVASQTPLSIAILQGRRLE